MINIEMTKKMAFLSLGILIFMSSCEEGENAVPPPALSFEVTGANEIIKVDDDLTRVTANPGQLAWLFTAYTPVGLNVLMVEDFAEDALFLEVYRDTLNPSGLYHIDITSNTLLSVDTFNINLTAIDNLDQVSTHRIHVEATTD